MATEPCESTLIGGIEKRDLRIVDYDHKWPGKFEKHARIIAGAIGDPVLRIEHVGSTSVPGLAAKPIIDILVVLPDSANESVYLPPLEAVGYVLRVREPNWHQHRMFRTSDWDVHIHIYSAGCPEIQRSLMFRDRLRSCAGDRRRYERVKRQLAAKDWPDMNAYALAKTDVIESILAAANAAGEVSD